jgi:F-type H+-transporting ATPase subunit b
VRRRILLAAAAVVVAVVAFAPAAGAQTEPRKLDKTEQECVDLLEKGKSVDDCQKAPSPILPATNELVWGAISFVILLGLLYKFAWPGLKKGLEGRTERIRSDLDAAESQRAEANQILSEYQAQLADAKNEAARVIEESRQTADAMRRDLQTRAEAEITEMRQRAAADIEAAKAQAIADLRNEVASLAIGAAEQVVGRSLDRDTNVALVEEYINRLAASN